MSSIRTVCRAGGACSRLAWVASWTLLACSDPHGMGAADGGGDARRDGGGGPAVDAGSCFAGGVLPTSWTIDIGASWIQGCGPGATVKYSLSFQVDAAFRVEPDGQVILVAPAEGGGNTYGVSPCQSFEVAEMTSKPQRMTLTDLSGTLDPTTCAFTLQVTGDVSTSPPYKFGAKATPMKWLYEKEGRGPYLEGAPIILPARDGASMTFGGMEAADVTNTIIVTIHEK